MNKLKQAINKIHKKIYGMGLWEEGDSLSELADKYDRAERREKEQLTKEEKEDKI